MEEMFKYKHIIREDGVEVVTIIHKGVHTFNSTTLIFPYIMECIKANKALYSVDDIISQKIVIPSQMEIKEHKFTINGEVIPDKLIQHHSDKLLIIQNLFMNLMNYDYNKEKTLSFLLENLNNVFPLTEDGFILLSNKKEDFENTPIFFEPNYNETITTYQNLNISKNIKQELLKKIKNTQENTINSHFLYLVSAFSQWDDNNLKKLMDIDFSFNRKDSFDKLFNFYEFYFKTPKSFLNFLNQFKVSIELLNKFNIVKKVLNPEIKINDLDKYLIYLDNTYNTYKIQIDYEKLIKTHPMLALINNQSVYDDIESELEIRYPKNAGEVTLWGNYMGNCFGSRANSYSTGSKCLFGLFKNDKLCYVFEVNYDQDRNSGCFGDFEGKQRYAPTKLLKSNIIELFKEDLNFNLRNR